MNHLNDAKEKKNQAVLIDLWILQIHFMNVQDLMNFEDMYALNDLAFCVQVLA